MSQPLVRSLAASALCLLGLASCQQQASAPAPDAEKAAYSVTPKTAPTPDPLANWEKGAWIERVAKLLRAGQGLDQNNPHERLAALLPREKSEIIDQLMADPLFGDAVLSFNLYFLGSMPDAVTDARHVRYASMVYDFPQAVAGARQILEGGDYLKLFDYEQPLFQGVLGRPYVKKGEDDGLSDSALRKKIFGILKSRLQDLITWQSQNPQATLGDFCAKAEETINQQPNIYSANLPDALFGGGGIYSEGWYGKAYTICLSSDPADKATPADLVAAIQMIIQKDDLLQARLAPFELENGSMHDVRDMRVLDLSGLVAARFKTTQFGPSLAKALVNSSTNYDRKRAAYVLKPFFCDDLTPIAVENPAVHAGDAHGSDPSCLACHYKLDPMAGFFKDLGFGFSDYTGAKNIQFDDSAKMDLATYVSAWKAPAGSSREWSIGYVRSVNHPELNDYGTSLEDLFAIIRRAPETRQCLVRRMFEYFVGEDRTLDPGYLDSLTAGFNAQVGAGASTAGFKATVKRLLLSQSFAQTNPVAGQCYDTAPGDSPENAPPCAAAYLLQKNCVHCHNSTDADFGGLDLLHWVKQPDGTYDFPYQDANLKQHTRRETFAKLLERISSQDPELRMPKHAYMSASDLDQLNAWFLKVSDPQSYR